MAIKYLNLSLNSICKLSCSFHVSYIWLTPELSSLELCYTKLTVLLINFVLLPCLPYLTDLNCKDDLQSFTTSLIYANPSTSLGLSIDIPWIHIGCITKTSNQGIHTLQIWLPLKVSSGFSHELLNCWIYYAESLCLLVLIMLHMFHRCSWIQCYILYGYRFASRPFKSCYWMSRHNPAWI